MSRKHDILVHHNSAAYYITESDLRLWLYTYFHSQTGTRPGMTTGWGFKPVKNRVFKLPIYPHRAETAFRKLKETSCH